MHRGALIRAINPDPPQLFPCATEPGKQQPCPNRIGNRGGGYHDDHQQAQRVHEDMPLPPHDLLARIMASDTRDLGRFDALTIQTASGRMRVATGLSPHRRTQGVIDALPGTIITLHTNIMVDRLPLWIVFWQHPPLDATHDEIEHRVDHLAHVQTARTTARFGGGDAIFDTPSHWRSLRSVR